MAFPLGVMGKRVLSGWVTEDWDGREHLSGMLNAAGFHYGPGTLPPQPIYWESEHFCQSLPVTVRPSTPDTAENSSHIPMHKHISPKQMLSDTHNIKFSFPSRWRVCLYCFFHYMEEKRGELGGQLRVDISEMSMSRVLQ